MYVTRITFFPKKETRLAVNNGGNKTNHLTSEEGTIFGY